MSTATKKSRVKAPQISGTRPSIHNNQLLVSTGVPSLDHVLGGGLAVGTVFLLEEDVYSSYSRMVLKYFLAEGVMCNHGLLLASADTQCQQILKELPGDVTDDPGQPPGGSSDTTYSSGATSGLDIAWRYQNKPQVQSSSTVSRFGHYYDLTKTMERQLVDNAEKTLIDVETSSEHQAHGYKTMRPSYQKVLATIKSQIEAGRYGTNVTSQRRNILRIGLHALGSPLWGEEVTGSRHRLTFDPSLPRFLYALRSLLRTCYAVCFITMPTHLFKDAAFVSRMHHLVDTVVRLEAFAGTANEKNPAYKEYHGLLHLVKLPRLNSLTCHMPDTLDQAFKLRRKKFMIERLHLPPELSETASRDQEDPDKPVKGPGTLCAKNTKSKLDF